MKSLLTAVLTITGMAYMLFANGYVALHLFDWFVRPIWEGAPVITYWEMAGIVLLWGFLAPSRNPFMTEIEDEGERTTKSVAYILAPWFTLLVGYILYLAIT